MPIGEDTHVTRGSLPHLSRPDKTYFVTFCTCDREELSEPARDIVLECCIAAHDRLHWLHQVVVMPDHVHLITTPFSVSLSRIVSAIKGASAHRVNAALNRKGALWQRESFDHILRSDESIAEKAEYIANNPVRKGLVQRPEDYRRYWRPSSVEAAVASRR